MRLKNIKEIESFREAVHKCKGPVWLESADGDVFNLKSGFSEYLAIGRLIEDKSDELELFARFTSDAGILQKFLIDTEQVKFKI